MCTLNDLFEAGPQLSATPFRPDQLVLTTDTVLRVEHGLLLRYFGDSDAFFPIGLAGPGDILGVAGGEREHFRAVTRGVVRSLPRDVLTTIPEAVIQRELLALIRRLEQAVRLNRGHIDERLELAQELLDETGVSLPPRAGGRALLAELIGVAPETVTRLQRKRRP